MELKKIGEILELQRGYDLPVGSMIQGDIPVVGSNGIVGYHNTSKSIVPTITMGRSGTIGKVHFYDRETWVHNTAMFVSDFKGNYPLYLYYLLDNLNFDNLKSSSVVPSLNRNFVYPMKVPFFSNKSDQERIANLLWNIDQKIALNTRMNSELETMAKQLYDYWFVQFDFPDENGNPYKSSGGEMVYNSTLKREIPAGWEISTLSSVIGKDKSGDWGQEVEKGCYTLKVNCIRGADLKDSFNAPTRFINANNKNRLLNEGDIIVEISGGSPVQATGRSLYVSKGLLEWYNNRLICSNFCRPLEIVDTKGAPYFYYTWNLLYDNNIMFNFEGKTSGIKNLLLDMILETNWYFPPSSINKSFCDFVTKNFRLIDSNKTEIENLTHLRDSLLPMLMNGQVTVE